MENKHSTKVLSLAFTILLPLLFGASSAHAGGTGTIVVYRTSIMGLIYQPKVYVNNQLTGLCAAGQKFSVTVPAGQHRISGKTIQKKEIIVSVAEGETIYMRCSIGLGVIAGNIVFKKMPAAKGESKSSKPKNKGNFIVKTVHAP